jgi:peptide/nickel transport system substrate-binding protein/oligopeptide transport system substrate-binding protein
MPGIVALLGTTVLLVSGCQIGGGGSSGPSNLAKNQVYNIDYDTGGSQDITTFDPTLTTDVVSIFPIDNVFSGLVTLNSSLNVENWDAKKIDVSSDGLTYTFHLRSGLFFSNGKAVTANDYAYAMNRALNPCVASGVSYYLYAIKDAVTFNSETCTNKVISGSLQTLVGDSIVATDAQTLTVTLAAPAAYFLEAMTYPTSYAIDQTVVGSDITSEAWLDTLKSGSTGQGGSGMFYVSSWDHSTGIDLKVNPHWTAPNGKKPFLTEIHYNFFKDADTGYAAYQSGQYDYGTPTIPKLEQARQQPDFHQYSTLTFYSVEFQWARAPFQNIDAREAFCLAINRDLLNTSILKSTGQPGWGIVPKGMPGYQPGITGPDGVTATTGDLTKAQAHFATYKATLNGKPLPKFDYLYVSSSTNQRKLAQALQAQWQTALGVNVTLDGVDFTTFLHRSAVGDFDISRFGWIADYPDPEDFLTLLFASNAQYNSQHADIPQADQLMFAADKNADQNARIQQYNQAEQLLVSQVATCPLWSLLAFYQVRSYVHGYSEDAQGLVPQDNYLNMYITSHT